MTDTTHEPGCAFLLGREEKLVRMCSCAEILRERQILLELMLDVAVSALEDISSDGTKENDRAIEALAAIKEMEEVDNGNKAP